TSRYGRLYVTFGDPIDVGDYLDQYEVTQASEDDTVSQLTQRLGYRVIYEIHQAGTATPAAVTALVLLNNPVRGLRRERLLELIGFVLDLLNQKGVRLSPSLKTSLASRRAQLQSALDKSGGKLVT